jgi:hypothetical protein
VEGILMAPQGKVKQYGGEMHTSLEIHGGHLSSFLGGPLQLPFPYTNAYEKGPPSSRKRKTSLCFVILVYAFRVLKEKHSLFMCNDFFLISYRLSDPCFSFTVKYIKKKLCQERYF